jgi:hypothetical protein
LEPFEFDHRVIFCGRESEIDTVLGMVNERHAVLVLGESGSGKSSLVLAGVIPTLFHRGFFGPREPAFCWGLLRPHSVIDSPDAAQELRALDDALYTAWTHDDEGSLKSALVPKPAAFSVNDFVSWLRGHHPEAGRTQYVLVLDQMEELFSGRLHTATLQRLFEILLELARNGLWLIATMTNEAEQYLPKYPTLAACFGEAGKYRLDSAYSATCLKQIIHEPAKAAGLTFEGNLEAVIFAAAIPGKGAVLPLLELLLTEMYLRRDKTQNLLRLQDYVDLGGLDGVISACAENIFRRMSSTTPAVSSPNNLQALLSHLLWKLFTADRVLVADYPSKSPMHPIIAAYRGVIGEGDRAVGRLLVQNDGIVRPAHTSLLEYWTRAQTFRDQQGKRIELWKNLIEEAKQWKAGERALMPSGPQLKAAAKLLESHRQYWTPSDNPAIDYIETSMHRRARRIVLAAVVSILLAVTTTGAVLYERMASKAVSVSFPRISEQIPVGKAPSRVAISPDGSEIYALNSADDTLTVISTLWDEPVATKEVGGRPNAIGFSADGAKAYIGLGERDGSPGGRIVVFDTMRREVSKTISVAGARPCSASDLAAHPDQRKLYVGFVYCGLYKLDPENDQLSRLDSNVKSLSCPEGIAFTPDGDRAYVSYQCKPEPGASGHDPIFVFDARTDRLMDAIARLSDRPGADRIPNVGSFLSIPPDGRWAWENGIDACARFNPRNLGGYDFEGCPPLSEPERQQVENEGYVGRGIINIINLQTKVVVPKGFPATDALSDRGLGASVPTFFPDGTQVAVSTQSRLLIYDAGTWERVGLGLPIPRASNLVFTASGHRAYVASGTNNLVYAVALVPDTEALGLRGIGFLYRELWHYAFCTALLSHLAVVLVGGLLIAYFARKPPARWSNLAGEER